MERDKDIEINDSASEAAFAKFQKELSEDKPQEEKVVEEDKQEEEPMGLMARRD
jgi:hypothetical protein